MNAYNQAYTEAIRTIPGVVAAHRKGNFADASFLLAGFLEDCYQLGLSHCTAWSIMTSASIYWTAELTDQLADATETDVEVLVQEVAIQAADWATSHGQ
jgi:hypothetical protein